MRKTAFLCLAAALLMVFSGCVHAQETDSDVYVMAGFDNTQYRNWSSNQFFARMEKWTGVRFEYRQYTNQGEWEKEKSSMTKDGDLPDVLFKAMLTTQECILLRERGVLIDLKPYLNEENAPNLWAILQDKPELIDVITLPDGSIAALPFINTLPKQNCIWVNTVWLKRLNLQTPKNAAEMQAVLTAFLERDPNQNGRRDEIPLGFQGPFDLKFLAHAYGLIANDYNIFEQDGKVRFMPLEENYRDFVQWCRDLYANRLLDKNGFIQQSRTITDNDAVSQYGMIIIPEITDVFKTKWALTDYSIMLPLEYDGKQIYRDFSGPILRGTFAVTSACKDPEKMIAWVDLMYSEEGACLANVGKENEDYVFDGDGTWRMTETASQNSSFYSALTLITGGATHPGILATDFEKKYGGEGSLVKMLNEQEAFNAYTRMPFPYYSLTEEQAQRIAPLQNAIGFYVDEQLARWVLGEDEISDASFDAFEAHLKELGLEEFLSFWQDVLDDTQGGKE